LPGQKPITRERGLADLTSGVGATLLSLYREPWNREGHVMRLRAVELLLLLALMGLVAVIVALMRGRPRDR
jgi:hypothetical protein